MVQAILEGRKSQTRRIVKHDLSMYHKIDTVGKSIFTPKDKFSIRGYWMEDFNIERYGESFLKCPYGQPGDVLWVRESFVNFCESIKYKADSVDIPKWKDLSFKPSIHMPRVAARIFLNVENVRVERLQEITQEDAKSEGIWPAPHRPASEGCKPHADNSLFNDCYVCSFKTLWNQINGTRASWESNPWVWVVEFSRMENYVK